MYWVKKFSRRQYTTNWVSNQYDAGKQSLDKKAGENENKIADTSDLATTAVLNTKLTKLRIKFLIMLTILRLLNLVHFLAQFLIQN